MVFEGKPSGIPTTGETSRTTRTPSGRTRSALSAATLLDGCSMRDPSMKSTSPGFIVRTTSAHAFSGAIVSAPFVAMIVHLPLRETSAVRYALSQSVTRGPTSTIPSRARASVISDAWGPVPIGLRETASAPIRRAAARTLKPALTWRPSSLPQSEPPPYTGAAPANTWSTRI